MKKRLKILFLFTLASTQTGMAKDHKDITDFEKGKVKSLMFKVADWQNQHTEHVQKYRPLNWHLAAYYIGIMEMSEATGEKKYFNQMLALGKKYNWATEDDMYDADRIAIGQMYLDVYKEKKQSEMIERVKWVLDAHIKRSPESYWTVLVGSTPWPAISSGIIHHTEGDSETEAKEILIPIIIL